MKLRLPVLLLIIIGCATCSKDSYNTTPTLKFEGVNGTVFAQPSVVNFKLTCTDKEGDVVDTIWIQRVTKIPACSDIARTDSFAIPEFNPPKNVKAEIDFTYNYPASSQGGASLGGCTNGSASLDDSCYFRFWIRDKAKHVSDTVQSPDLVLLKQ